MQVKSDIIQGVINRAKTAVRNFGENAQIELPAELVKNICQSLNAERYRLAQLNKKYSTLKQQLKSDVCNERMVNPNNEAFHICELSFYHWLQREYKPGYFENQ